MTENRTPAALTLGSVFYAAVLLFMLVCPAASVLVDLGNGGGEPVMAVVGTWFVFWAVGVRLFTAGVRQIVKPGLTSEGILRIPGREVWVLVRELGFANVATGLAGILALWNAPWRPAVALVGGLFLSLAGVLHVLRRAPGCRGERGDGLRPRDRGVDARVRGVVLDLTSR